MLAFRWYEKILAFEKISSTSKANMPLPITDSSVRVTRMFICLVGWISFVLGNKEKLVIAGIDTERHEWLSCDTYHAVERALKSINDGQELRNYYLEINWKKSKEYNKVHR